MKISVGPLSMRAVSISILIIFAFFPSLSRGAPEEPAAQARSFIFAEIGYGRGDNEIGRFHNDGNRYERGPVACCADGAGSVYIADNVNWRVMKIAAAGSNAVELFKYGGTALSSDVITDMNASSGFVYFTGLKGLYRFKPPEYECERIARAGNGEKLAAPRFVFFDSDENLIVADEFAGERSFAIFDRKDRMSGSVEILLGRAQKTGTDAGTSGEVGEVRAKYPDPRAISGFAECAGPENRLILNRTEAKKFSVVDATAENTIYFTYKLPFDSTTEISAVRTFGCDEHGNLYAAVTESAAGEGAPVAQYILKYSSKGKLLKKSRARVPLSEATEYPRHFLLLYEDGAVAAEPGESSFRVFFYDLR